MKGSDLQNVTIVVILKLWIGVVILIATVYAIKIGTCLGQSPLVLFMIAQKMRQEPDLICTMKTFDLIADASKMIIMENDAINDGEMF